jgi:hypothetical protein
VKPGTIVRIILGVLLFSILGCVGAFFGVRYLLRQNELKPFTAHLQEYASAGQNNAAQPSPYIKGKVIPVDTASQKIDWIYYDLPTALKPATPDDVGTVVLLTYVDKEVGKYSNGGTAYKRTCNVAVVDFASKTVVGRAYFEGGEPPSTIRNSSSGYGPYPTEQILSYVKSLPRN